MERYSPYDGLEAPTGGDAILALGQEFLRVRESRKDAISGVVGIYHGRSGEEYIFPTVLSAWKEVGFGKANYLPANGDPDFIRGTAEIIFGQGTAQGLMREKRLATLGTPGGTGGLSVWSSFHRATAPDKPILVSNPTWPNHIQILRHYGVSIITYPHLKENKYNLEGHLEAIDRAPMSSVILEHTGKTHNPTGANPKSIDEWRQIAQRAKGRRHQALFDTAYAGFGDDLVTDTLPIRIFMEEGVPVTVVVSCAKNMALYKERAGAVLIPTDDPKIASTVQDHLKRHARALWSTPPAQGERVAGYVLSHADLHNRWERELATVAQDIQRRRELLANALGDDFSFLKGQKGLFSLLPMPDEAVSRLREEDAIFLLPGGDTRLARVNVTGIPEAQIERFAVAVRKVMSKIQQ